MSNAFPKAKRLLKKEEYESVFKQSKKTKKIETDVFFVLASPNDKQIARIGFALSKKVLPKAHMRNRVKRIFREDFRTKAITLKPVDIVVLAKFGLKTSTNSTIRHSLSVLWQKINQL